MVTLPIWNKTLLEQELEHNEQLIRIVLEQFLMDIDLLVSQLIQCSASVETDHQTVVTAAHALKGAAAQARCELLSSTCAQIEKDFREHKESATLPKAKLLIEVQQVEKMVTSYLRHKNR